MAPVEDSILKGVLVKLNGLQERTLLAEKPMRLERGIGKGALHCETSILGEKSQMYQLSLKWGTSPKALSLSCAK